MSEPDVHRLRDLAVDLAMEAGDLLRTRRPLDLDTSTKTSPTDLVTVMDAAAERLIVDGLHRARPDDDVLAEEGSNRSGTTGVRWVIDPLDGTVNYVYNLPSYGVSIGVEVDGVTVAGAVCDVPRETLYEAVLGEGARADGDLLRASDATDLSVALVGTGFSYSATERAAQGQVLAALLPQIRDIRRFGAAAIDLCALADGRLDAFFEIGLKPWDRAAGLLIAAEAGVRWRVLQTTDGELTMAAAPGLFDELEATLLPRYTAV